MAKIHRENLNKTVYSVLKEMIVDCRFKPGERINVEKLTKELGVSRTPVWEAIRRLEHESLVVNVRNRGIYMNTLSQKEALDLFAAREVLERMVARLAAERIEDRDLANLERCLARQKKWIEKNDIVSFTREDFYFHNLIHKASGNAFVSEILANIWNKIHPVVAHVDGFWFQFHEEHSAMLQALRQHDPEKTEEMVDRHNRDVIEIIRSGDLTYVRPPETERQPEAALREHRRQTASRSVANSEAESGPSGDRALPARGRKSAKSDGHHSKTAGKQTQTSRAGGEE